jgi:hypothetical protein
MLVVKEYPESVSILTVQKLPFCGKALQSLNWMPDNVKES